MSNEAKASAAPTQEQKDSAPEDSDTSIGNHKNSRRKPRVPTTINKVPNSLPRVQSKNKKDTNVPFSSHQHSSLRNKSDMNKLPFPSPSASAPKPPSHSNTSSITPPTSHSNTNNGLIINRNGLKNGNSNGRKSKKKAKQRQIDNSSNGYNDNINSHNTNGINSNSNNRSSAINNVNRNNGTVINYQHNQNNIHIMNNHPLVRGPEHFNKLIENFGCPDNVSDFNLMAIAGVLQEGQHIHKNRELKAQIVRFQKKIQEQQKDIDSLKEQSVVYKKQADEAEHRQIQNDKLMALNKKMLENYKTRSAEVHRLQIENSKLRQQRLRTHFKPIQGGDDDNEGMIPLPIDDGNTMSPPNTNILAPDANNDDNHNHNDNVALQPLPTTTEDENKVNENENSNNKEQGETNGENEEEGPRQVSAFVRNQRLIQLTGNQTYMTAHQKVIRDPKSRSKSHMAYQRKDTWKSIQQENKTLREQIVKLTQELEEAINGDDKTADGVTAEHLKKQLKECRRDLEIEKKVNAKYNAALNTKGDEQALKQIVAQKSAELARLNVRYEASKERVEKLAKERDQYKTLSDAKHKENIAIKEKTQAMIQKTKTHIVTINNDKEHWKNEATRLVRANQKLTKRESKEEELDKEIIDLKKKLKHSEGEVTKYKKRYKDLKLQIDTAGPGALTLRSRSKRPRGRPRKNEHSIYVSTDSSDAAEIDATVDFLQALDEAEKKSNNDSVNTEDNTNTNTDKKEYKKKYKKPYNKKYQKNYKKGGYKKGNYKNGGYRKYGKKWNKNESNDNSNTNSNSNQNDNQNSNGNSALNDILRSRGNRDTSNKNNNACSPPQVQQHGVKAFGFTPDDNAFDDMEDLDWSDDDDQPILAGGNNNLNKNSSPHQVKLPLPSTSLGRSSNISSNRKPTSFFGPPPSDAAFVDVPDSNISIGNGNGKQQDNDLMSYGSISSPKSIQIDVPSVGSIDIDIDNDMLQNATTNAIDTATTNTDPLQNQHDNDILSKIENNTNPISDANNVDNNKNNDNNTNNMNTDNQNDADDESDEFYDEFNTMTTHFPSAPSNPSQPTQPTLNSAFADNDNDNDNDNNLQNMNTNELANNDENDNVNATENDTMNGQPHTDDDTESLFNIGSGTTSPNLAALSNKHQNPFNNNDNDNNHNNNNNNNVAALALDVDNDDNVNQSPLRSHESEPINSSGPQPLFGNVFDDSEAENSDLSNMNIQSPQQQQPATFAPLQIVDDQLDINTDNNKNDAQNDSHNDNECNDDQQGLPQMPDPGDSEDDEAIMPISKEVTTTSLAKPGTTAVSFDVEVGLKVDNENNAEMKENVIDDESDDDAPIIPTNGPIDAVKMENTMIKVDQNEEDDLRAILSKDITSSNNRKRQRQRDNANQQDIIIEPVSKKRKLDHNHNQPVSINHSTDHFDVADLDDLQDDNLDLDDLDDFDQFMATDNTNNAKTESDIKPSIPVSLSAPPMATSSNSSSNLSKKLPVKTENVANNDMNINTNSNTKIKIQPTVSSLPFTADYINNQFEDWRAEFRFMITQKQDNSINALIDSSIHSILCRWKYPQVPMDRNNSSKEVAENIIQIVVNGCFDEIFIGENCFDANNKSIYMSQIELLGQIMQRLTRSKSKPNLLSRINKGLQKIIHKKTMIDKIHFGPKIHFCAGLLSLICRLTKNEGFFWRAVIQTIDAYELWESAEIFAIMFECYPQQITAHKDAFVQNCLKCIFLGHNHSLSQKPDYDPKFGDISKIKQCYQRLMNVVNGHWNYMNPSSKDRLIRQSINTMIQNNGSDELKNADCQTGILLICACDIGYATNHFLPKILYPIMWQQFQYQKPVVQVFLLELYYDCCCKISKRLMKCKQPQAQLIKKNITTLMTTLVSLSVASSSSISGTNLVDPSVTVCCLRHLYQMKNHSYIQLLIADNAHSEQQLLQFATLALKTWSLRLNGIKNVSARKSEEQLFFGMTNILGQTFKAKQYQSMGWEELKDLYRNEKNTNKMVRK